jgi:hypothetical protein
LASRWGRSPISCTPEGSWTRRCGSAAKTSCRSTSGWAAALAAGLAHNTSFDELGLASNAIGAAGAAVLAGALAGHPRLAVLALGTVTSASALGEAANRLGDDGAIAIAPLVAATRTLRALDLHDNGITSHGAMAILRALEGNASLIALGLHRFVAKTIHRRIRARLAANAVHAPWPPGMPRHVAMIQSVYRAPRPTGAGRVRGAMPAG